MCHKYIFTYFLKYKVIHQQVSTCFGRLSMSTPANNKYLAFLNTLKTLNCNCMYLYVLIFCMPSNDGMLFLHITSFFSI